LPPPPPADIRCGESTKFDGGQSYPTVKTVDLGVDAGTVFFSYNTYGNPDALQVRTRHQAV
jgi:hypothetical protein